MIRSSSQKLSLWSILRANAWMLVIYTLGTSLTWWVGWPLGFGYLAYCAASLLYFIATICPYCSRSALQSCPDGYHWISRWFPTKPGRTFSQQYKRNIIVMYPVWFVPPLAGAYMLFTTFSWLALMLFAAFCLVGFVILPQMSKRHNCTMCENIDNCPRMKAKK